MSEYEIEYCPWCGSDVERTIEQHGHASFAAKKCVECETVFRVSVPYRETEIKWTNAT